MRRESSIEKSCIDNYRYDYNVHTLLNFLKWCQSIIEALKGQTILVLELFALTCAIKYRVATSISGGALCSSVIEEASSTMAIEKMATYSFVQENGKSVLPKANA